MPIPPIRLVLTATAALALSATPIGAAHAMQQGEAASTLTWTDIADLSDAANIVVRAKIKKQAELKPERAPGLAPGYTRLYIEAETLALIAGSAPVGESLRYLVDVPLTAKGRAPKLRKSEVILFARPVPARPGEIQLVASDAQLPWPSAPPVVVGVRDALSVAGNLSGESETQIFLATANGAPVALSVVRRPGAPPVWGVSYSEIVDQAVRAPQPQTLNWYRLACFLPRELPGSAHLSQDRADRARADNDYRYVLEQLGACNRTRMPPPAA